MYNYLFSRTSEFMQVGSCGVCGSPELDDQGVVGIAIPTKILRVLEQYTDVF